MKTSRDDLPELFSDAKWRQLADRLDLTPRQLAAARLVCRGCTTQQIAARIGISPDTARLHLRKLFARLDVHDRVGVVVLLVLADRKIGGKG
ncbi:MAG: helix-turn-helix transcriptional regulator [Phycisphaerae bacterium]|nr:helix-turn-helix transcriptional regulator [Phycisphaerae bacterium]